MTELDMQSPRYSSASQQTWKRMFSTGGIMQLSLPSTWLVREDPPHFPQVRNAVLIVENNFHKASNSLVADAQRLVIVTQSH